MKIISTRAILSLLRGIKEKNLKMNKMEYDKLKEKVSEFLGTLIDEEHIGLEEDAYDIGLEFEFEEIVDKVDDFLKQVEKNTNEFKQEENKKHEENIRHLSR